MKIKHLLSLMLAIVITIPMSGWGQALFDIESIRYEPSRFFPILSDAEIVGTPDSPIPRETIQKITDRCKSRIPPRFSPDALNSYCACASASTLGTLTVGELRDLQKETNRKLGNPVFEKYVENVMKPCMEIPIEDIEYLFCISSRKNDWRIKYPIPFCRCVSTGIRDHFKETGLEDMMIAWGKVKKENGSDPTESIWDNDTFLRARGIKKEECVGSYMDPQNFK